MTTLKFKTNINCGGCIAKVTPFMNANKDIVRRWQVDTTSPDRILSVETEGNAGEVIEIVEKAGFQATVI